MGPFYYYRFLVMSIFCLFLCVLYSVRTNNILSLLLFWLVLLSINLDWYNIETHFIYDMIIWDINLSQIVCLVLSFSFDWCYFFVESRNFQSFFFFSLYRSLFQFSLSPYINLCNDLIGWLNPRTFSHFKERESYIERI